MKLLPGDLVLLHHTVDVITGWKNVPDYFDRYAPRGLVWPRGTLGVIIAVQQALPNAPLAAEWHCILVSNRGYSWFPRGDAVRA
jgi:hypothetical protein